MSLGDCEDSAILLGSIIQQLGYGVKGVLLPGHMAIGIKGSAGLPGTYYEQAGVRYYYVETTGDGWRVGEVPEAHRGSSARLVDLYGYPVLNYRVRMASEGLPTLWYTLQNHGDAVARDVSVTAQYLDAADRLVNGTRETVASLQPDQSTRVQVPLLSPPPETAVRLHTTVAVGGQVHVVGRSDLLKT